MTNSRKGKTSLMRDNDECLPFEHLSLLPSCHASIDDGEEHHPLWLPPAPGMMSMWRSQPGLNHSRPTAADLEIQTF
jgi:hypothetical protein